MAPTLLKGETDLMYVKQQGTRGEKLMDLYPLTLVIHGTHQFVLLRVQDSHYWNGQRTSGSNVTSYYTKI